MVRDYWNDPVLNLRTKTSGAMQIELGAVNACLRSFHDRWVGHLVSTSVKMATRCNGEIVADHSMIDACTLIDVENATTTE